MFYYISGLNIRLLSAEAGYPPALASNQTEVFQMGKKSPAYLASKTEYERVKVIRKRVLEVIAPQAIKELNELFREYATGGMGQFLQYGIAKSVLVWHELDEILKLMTDTSDAALLLFTKKRILDRLRVVTDQVTLDAGITG